MSRKTMTRTVVVLAVVLFTAGLTPHAARAQGRQLPAPQLQLSPQAKAAMRTRATLQRSYFAVCTLKMQALGFCQTGAVSTGEAIPAFLGRGWNEILDADLPSLYSCLDAFTVETPGLVGATIQSRIEIVAASSAINDALNLDGRIGGALPVKQVPVSGTLEGDILRISNVHQSVLTVTARTAITFRPQRIATVPAISQAALQTLAQPIAFRDKCGDKFVDEVSPGGEFIAVIKIFSRDTALQSTIAQRIAAGVGAFGSTDQAAQSLDAVLKSAGAGAGAGVNTGGSVTTRVDTKEVQIQIETLQRGGSNRSNVTTVAQLIDRYRTFPSTVRRAEDTVPMAFHLQAYTNAGNGGQVRGRLFAINDRTSLVTTILWPTYMNYILAEEALTFWLQQCGSQPSSCAPYFSYDRQKAQTLLTQIGVGLVGIEAAADECGRGLACTASRLESVVPGDHGNAIIGQLPVRRQFYDVGAKAFMEAARQRGAPSGGVIIADGPLNTKGTGHCVIDQKEGWDTPGLPTAQHVRVWTARGVTGTSCRFRFFDGGKLRAPWDIQSTDFDIDGVNQTLEKPPRPSDLTLKIKQVSPLASIAPDTTAILRSLVLIGPAGDPATEPWRQAIRD
jgi:hypothetical protein